MQSVRTPKKYGSSQAIIAGTSDHFNALFLSVSPLTLTKTVWDSRQRAKVLSDTRIIQGSLDLVLLVGKRSVCFPSNY